MGQPHPSLTLEAYAEQLRQGFRWLNFSPALEQEYQHAQQARIDHQTLVAGYCGLAVWLLYGLVDQWRLGLFHSYPHWTALQWQLVTVRCIVLAVFIGCVAAFVDPPRGMNRRRTVAGMLMLLALGAIIANSLYGQMGLTRESSVLLLLVMAMFLPLGLALQQCVILALTCMVMVLLVGAAVPELEEQHQHLAFAMVVATGVGTLGAYQREYGLREQFLLRCELEWLARRDPLTGLHNRRAFNEHLQMALRAAHRDQRQLGLMMIDADHFKQFNDSQGHAAGDEALRRMASVLQSAAARPLDLAARTGGEEMAVLLYDVNGDGLARQAQAIIEQVRALAIHHPTSPTGTHMTVSLGFTLSTADDSSDSIYKRADKLLYCAKREGRGRARTDDGVPRDAVWCSP